MAVDAIALLQGRQRLKIKNRVSYGLASYKTRPRPTNIYISMATWRGA